MPGNKSIFNDAMKKAHGWAWDQKWPQALAEYRRALAEFPEDTTALAALGHALDAAGQTEEALRVYRVLSKLQPHDLIPLSKIAALQEKMGYIAEAASTFYALAETYAAHKQLGKAVEAWQRAAALEPERTDAHLKLAEVYQAGGHLNLAAKELVAVARILQRRGEPRKALEFAKRAADLDANNPVARQMLEATAPRETRPTDTGSPIEQAERAALSRLAETVFMERPEWARGKDIDPSEVEALTARAIAAQTQHNASEAIDCYRQLLAAGVRGPEIIFNLGLLYQETFRVDEALPLLTESAKVPEYALASHFALGQAYRAQGRLDAALEHFMQVLKIVDLSTVKREQADDLIRLYQNLADSYAAKGDREQARSFTNSLVDLLNSRGWEDKVVEVRRHLEAISEEGFPASLAEVLELPESERVIEALARSQELLNRNLLAAAGEEVLRAIELAPYYLPAHVRLVDIYQAGGKTDQARDKLSILADLALVRGDVPKAIVFYRRLLKLEPGGVTSRAKLIDLLIGQSDYAGAMDEYASLGDAYAASGAWDQAVEKYTEGLRLTARAGLPAGTVNKLKHRLADARVKQNDLRGAARLLQEIRAAAPEDERARFRLIDLALRTGDRETALRELDDLVGLYRGRNELHKASALLEDLVQAWPLDEQVVVRLANTYAMLGQKDKALAALDALGDRQLSAGQNAAAVQTIERILALAPPNAAEYHQLLAQLKPERS